MKWSIRSHGEAISEFLLDLRIVAALAFGAYEAKRRIEHEIGAGAQVQRFSYSHAMRSVMAVFTLLFATAALLPATLPESIAWWFPAGSFIGVIVGVPSWFRLAGDMVVDEGGVTMVRLWMKNRIEYGEIRLVRSDRFGNFMVLHGANQKLRVEHHLERYEGFSKRCSGIPTRDRQNAAYWLRSLPESCRPTEARTR